ncbi:MAG: hypothetical protein AAB677_01395 [Patescibacteria group bacterium]
MPSTIETQKPITQARREIASVLRRYRLEWEEVAPDRDDLVWKKIKPFAKKIRKELFRKSYPSLVR